MLSGENGFGQFGDGTNAGSTDEVKAIMNEDKSGVLQNVEKIEAGDRYTLLKLSNGKIYACGINKDYILGVNDIEESNVILENSKVSKLLAETSESIMQIASGGTHASIALTNGDVYSWGQNKYGELGNGLNEDSTEPKKAGKGIIISNTNSILIHENETVNLESIISYFNLLKETKGEISYESKDETIVALGAQEMTQNGTTKVTIVGVTPGISSIVIKENGTNNIGVVQVRVLPVGIKVEPQVKTNGSNTITLKANGEVWSYGKNENGELGNGTKTFSDMPVKTIFPANVIIKQIDIGENFAAALDTNGEVWVWGKNDYGQLRKSIYR